jgi:hypothetical protein
MRLEEWTCAAERMTNQNSAGPILEEGFMSLKNKRHKRQRAENGQFVSSDAQQTAESMISDIGGKAQSALGSVRETASSNKKMLGGIAAGLGVGAYMMATERGRGMTNRISCAITDSVGGIRDRASTVWDQVVSSVSELSARFRGSEEASDVRKRAA